MPQMARLTTGRVVVSLLRATDAVSARQAVARSGGRTTTTSNSMRTGHRTAAGGGADPDVGQRAIILYTKEKCPLCDGLKDKVQAILDRAPFTGSALQGYRLEPRDIMSNAEWETRYGMEIPVIAVMGPDGAERMVPRQSPRVTADRLERAIVESLVE